MPILLLAALLRLSSPGVVEFKYDEARLAGIVLDWLQGAGGPLPYSGMISSAGVNEAPAGYYLYALPFALSPTPASAALFVELLNVAAVALCYALAWRWFGAWGAWPSALLFAAAPWAVLYSRKLWTLDLLPPFVILVVLAGYFALIERRARWFWVLPVAIALTVQMHFSGIAIALWGALALLVFWRRVRPLPLLGGTLLGLLTWAPYGVYLAQHWATHAGTALQRLGGPARIDARALRYAWLLTTGSEIHSLAGPSAFRAFLASLPPYETLFAVGGLLALAGSAWLVWRMLRPGTAGRERDVAILLLMWLALPVAVGLRHSMNMYIHYLIPLFPATFLAVGALAAALRARAAWLGRAVGVVIVAVALGQALTWGALMSFVATHATPGAAGGLLQTWQPVVDRVRAEPACDVRIVGDGTDPAYDEIPAVFHALMRGDPRISFLDARAGPALLPAHSAFVVLSPREGSTPRDAWPAALDEIASFPSRTGEAPAQAGRYPAGLRAGHSVDARFANGVRLLASYATEAPAPGQTTRLYLLWELTNPPADEIHVFNHVLDAAGTRAGQNDGEICARAAWRAGFRVWTWFDVALDPAAGPGPYSVRTGLYTYPQIVSVPLAGSTRDAVVWPLIVQ